MDQRGVGYGDIAKRIVPIHFVQEVPAGGLRLARGSAMVCTLAGVQYGAVRVGVLNGLQRYGILSAPWK